MHQHHLTLLIFRALVFFSAPICAAYRTGTNSRTIRTELFAEDQGLHAILADGSVVPGQVQDDLSSSHLVTAVVKALSKGSNSTDDGEVFGRTKNGGDHISTGESPRPPDSELPEQEGTSGGGSPTANSVDSSNLVADILAVPQLSATDLRAQKLRIFNHGPVVQQASPSSPPPGDDSGLPAAETLEKSVPPTPKVLDSHWWHSYHVIAVICGVSVFLAILFELTHLPYIGVDLSEPVQYPQGMDRLGFRDYFTGAFAWIGEYISVPLAWWKRTWQFTFLVSTAFLEEYLQFLNVLWLEQWWTFLQHPHQ